MKQVITPPSAEADPARPEIGEVVGGRDHVRADIHIQGGQQDRDQRNHHRQRRMKPRNQLHRVPDRRAVDDDRRRGHQNTDQRVQRHGGGQGERLSDDLLALAAREAREVGNVERNRRPESYCRIQRGNQELQKIRKAGEARRRRQHRAESACVLICPAQQQQSHAPAEPAR